MTRETFLKKLGKRVKIHREKAGLTQPALAALCDKEKQSINRLEKGGINISVWELQKIAKELKVDLKDLLDFD
jgi:putative transcriptional regulator